MIKTKDQIDRLLTRHAEGKPVEHHMLPTLARMTMSGVAPIMVGPSGCGKTQLAATVAAMMKLKFYYARAVRDEFALIGYVDANGRLVRTAFRDAFERGGVFLMDEMDAGDPRALLAFNEAFANRRCDFPDGIMVAHQDFHIIAAANTHGTGRSRQYVGRNQLDGTTLDRFGVLEVGYDRALEARLEAPTGWLQRVRDARDACEYLQLRHIVSMRALVDGARLINGGFDWAFTEKSVLWRGLPEDQVEKARQRVQQLEQERVQKQLQAERDRQNAKQAAARRGQQDREDDDDDPLDLEDVLSGDGWIEDDLPPAKPKQTPADRQQALDLIAAVEREARREERARRMKELELQRVQPKTRSGHLDETGTVSLSKAQQLVGGRRRRR